MVGLARMSGVPGEHCHCANLFIDSLTTYGSNFMGLLWFCDDKASL